MEKIALRAHCHFDISNNVDLKIFLDLLTHNGLPVLSTACVALQLIPEQWSQSAHGSSIRKTCHQSRLKVLDAGLNCYSTECVPEAPIIQSQDRMPNFTSAKIDLRHKKNLPPSLQHFWQLAVKVNPRFY